MLVNIEVKIDMSQTHSDDTRCNKHVVAAFLYPTYESSRIHTHNCRLQFVGTHTHTRTHKYTDTNIHIHSRCDR